MEQSGEDTLGGQAFEVVAGFTQARPKQSHCANLKFVPDQVIQRNASRHYVSPCRSGRDHNSLFAFECLNRFDFDECDFATSSRGSRPVPSAFQIAVALEPTPDNRFCVLA